MQWFSGERGIAWVAKAAKMGCRIQGSGSTLSSPKTINLKPVGLEKGKRSQRPTAGGKCA